LPRCARNDERQWLAGLDCFANNLPWDGIAMTRKTFGNRYNSINPQITPTIN